MVGVLMDDAGRALIAQRVAGKPHAGAWEFPGGKLEAGENRIVGLARELREELGIEIESPRPLIRVVHAYSYGRVLLDVWVIRRFAGEPTGLDGQALYWCPRTQLMGFGLLPADRPIVAALSLPERLLDAVTDEYVIGLAGTALLQPDSNKLRGVLCQTVAEAHEAALERADFIVLRDRLHKSQLTTLCAEVSVPIYAAGLELKEAWRAGATGLNQLGT